MEDNRNKVSRKLKTLLVIAVLVILLLMILFFALGLNESAEKTIKKTITNIIFQTNVSCKSNEKMMGINEDGTINCAFDSIGGGGGGVGGGIASESDPYWIASYSLFNDSWSYTFNQTTNDSLNNYISSISTSSNITFGMIVGFTTLSYDGNLVSGSDIGYVAGNKICNIEYSGSHFCLESEVIKTIASGNYSFTGTYWMARGAPGYTANADDCAGWTTNSNTYLGPFWNWDGNAQAGYGRLTNCAQTKQLMCCK